MKILMVCLGNICRSPLAEGILQKMANERKLNWEIDSASTETYHIGNPPFHFSQKVALENGIDISQHKAQRFNSSHFEYFDVIYSMAEDVLHEMYDIVSQSKLSIKVKLLLEEFPSSQVKSLTVPDPYYGGYDDFVKVYSILYEACQKIIEKYI